MATATQEFGVTQPLVVTALQSLGDDAFWQSDKVTNSSIKGFWAEVFLTIVTNASAAADANGVINLRMAASEDNILFAGQLTGTEGTFADTLNTDHRHTTPVASFSCDALEAAARTYRYRAVIHDLPEFFALLVENKSGLALGSAGNECEFRLHKYNSS